MGASRIRFLLEDLKIAYSKKLHPHFISLKEVARLGHERKIRSNIFREF